MSNADTVLARLTKLDWFKYVDPAAVDDVRARFRDAYAKSPSVLAPEEEVTTPKGAIVGMRGIDRRSCFADPEDLAEGSISSVFHLLREAFAQEGVRFEEMTDDASEDGYALVIDGKRHVLFDEPDYEWDEAVARTCSFANELLASAGSRVRLFSIGINGNDGWMILLSPDQLAYVTTLEISPQLDLEDVDDE